MLGFDQLSLFLGAALMIAISPGPDLLYVTSIGAANGKRVGTAAVLGIAVGALVHVAAAASGVSAMLASSKSAFTILKWMGATYLVYLGVQAVRGAGTISLGHSAEKLGVMAAFRRGVIVDLLNPKPAMFLMAFLPQFANAEAGYVPLQLLVLGWS